MHPLAYILDVQLVNSCLYNFFDQVGAIDISKTLNQTCVDLGRQYRKDDILCLPCDVTDSKKLVSMYNKEKIDYP